MKTIIDVLMSRDGMTKREAVARKKEVKRMMEECNFDPVECEDIMLDELGLEMDYIFEMLF